MLFLVCLIDERCAFYGAKLTQRTSRPTTFFGFAGWLGSGFLGRSTTYAFYDLGKPIASLGEAVEVVLALAAGVYDSTVPQQS